MNLFILLFFTVLISCSQAYAEYPIVYLISPTRSLSTAFLRIMHARGDFEVFNEPSQRAKALIKKAHPTMFRENGCKTFQAVKKQLYSYAKTKNVFAKDMCFSVNSFLRQHKDFVQNPQVHFVFLVRNPHSSMISYYKKHKTKSDDKNLNKTNKFTFWGGLDVQLSLIQFIKKTSPNKPIIVLAEKLCNRPEETLKSFCARLKIPYKENALHWDDLGDNFTGVNEWHEIKHTKFTHYWHGDAIHSTGLKELHSYVVDQNGNPTFAEIDDPIYRIKCFEVYRKHLKFYKKILKWKDLIA